MTAVVIFMVLEDEMERKSVTIQRKQSSCHDQDEKWWTMKVGARRSPVKEQLLVFSCCLGNQSSLLSGSVFQYSSKTRRLLGSPFPFPCWCLNSFLQAAKQGRFFSTVVLSVNPTLLCLQLVSKLFALDCLIPLIKMGLIAAQENHLQRDAYKSLYVDLPVGSDCFILSKTTVLSFTAALSSLFVGCHIL